MKSFRTMLAVALASTVAVGVVSCRATGPAASPALRATATTPVLIQGSDLESVSAAVASVGGTVTHELGIIRAVGARLTAAQRTALAAHPSVTRIYEDRTVEVEAAALETVRDEFGSLSFDNQDGSVAWSGPWDEVGESNGPTSGTVRVVDENASRCADGSNCLRIGGDEVNLSGRGVRRAVDLTGCTQATLSFTHARSGNNHNAAVAVALSADGGGSWLGLARYEVGGSQDPATQTFDVSAFCGAAVELGFLASGSTDDPGYAYFDDVEISFDASNGSGGGSGGGGASGPLLATLKDRFDRRSYDGSNGSQSWSAGPWTEIAEPNGAGPEDGPVQISPNTTYCKTPPCLRVGGTKPYNPDPGFGVYRDADLGGVSTATLSFTYRRGEFDGGTPTDGILSLDLSSDGGATWTTVATYPFDGVDKQQTAQSFDISDLASANTRIRFLTRGPVDDIVFFIDDLEIEQTLVPYSEFPRVIGADLAHAAGFTGRGATVAVLDTGVSSSTAVTRNTDGGERLLALYDAQLDQEGVAEDGNGHGTHVAGVIVASHRARGTSELNGVAPDAGLVVVKAFDADGQGSYADVIRGLDWIVGNRDRYGIGVLNLSFSAEPRSHYWDDPLNQAVMAAWKAGIFVVASAGNRGPDPMTIGVPGNVPYAMTVGALSDGVTPDQPGDDFLTSFSSTGPTVEGFVKPEVVAPGGHVLGPAVASGKLASLYPEWLYGDYFYMSGTSQAAAVVSGVAALMLGREPGLGPDDLKCRLLATARPAVDNAGNLAYSVFQQGAGVVYAEDALASNEGGCANRGLDVARDLRGRHHYGGRANQSPDGSFFIMDLPGDGHTWDGSYNWTDAYFWSDAYLWSNAYFWSDAFLWSDAYFWSTAYLWSNAYLWSTGLTEPMAINGWVEQE